MSDEIEFITGDSKIKLTEGSGLAGLQDGGDHPLNTSAFPQTGVCTQCSLRNRGNENKQPDLCLKFIARIRTSFIFIDLFPF